MHVEKQFMEIDYNMLVQDHVHYKYVVLENHLLRWWCMVKDLTPQCGGEEFKSPIYNLGYLGYLGDLIR
jgi:hypothetical protein